MAGKTGTPPDKTRRGKGFARTSTLLQSRIREAGESRGFAVARLLTHWEDIVGQDVARCTRPVKVGYGRDGIGATLTVLTTGAHAPLLEMQKETIRSKVNACYGYAAISKLRITQTAPQGFAEGQAVFERPAKSMSPRIDPKAAAAASEATAEISNERLRRALEDLGAKVLSRTKT